ncbi:hypothetical protein Q3G72_029494 [Acer saccharum]|nr:hypothetical protein Q3G72_029494 [Acer saccharum]
MNEVKELNEGLMESIMKKKKDVKFAPAVAELDLTTLKEGVLVSEKQNIVSYSPYGYNYKPDIDIQESR